MYSFFERKYSMSYRKYAKIMSGLLALLLLSASCQSSVDDGGQVTSSVPDSDAATEETTSYLETIPVYDFGGADFRLLVNSQSDRPNLHAGELNGEVINDAMYNRDQTVAEMYNLNFVYTAYDTRGELYSDVSRLITAGEDCGEVIITSLTDGIGDFALNGMLSDLNAYDALSLESEWWCQSMNETMTTGDKIYATTGPMALCYAYSPYAFFVNLTMADEWGLEDVYSLVESGDWTIDKMNELMKNSYSDSDGDGVPSVGDSFGLTTTHEAGKAFYIGCGMRMAEKTPDGAELLIDSPMSIEVLDKLHGIMTNEYVFCTETIGTSANTGDYKTLLFTNSQTLFCAAPIQWGVLNFRDMNDDYGILPYPKYDTNQTEYYSHINPFFPVGIAIPVTNQKPDETAAVMEALAYISNSEMLPKINEVVLKEKIARDEKSKEMLDLLYENMVVDLNCVYDFAGSATKLRLYAIGQSDNFSSEYASIKEKAESELAKMLE